MEDMNLSDRFHAAFDVAPPAGGFDRLRRELSRPPADRRSRPAFHMRNKMTLRLTAAVAAVVIAIALVAAYLVAQRPTTSSVPAASTAAYRNMIYADHDALINTYSSTACIKYTDPTCAPAIAGIRIAMQKWLSDLQAFSTPRQFSVTDRQLRLHLNATISALNLASTAITAGNESAFTALLDDFGGGHQAPWLDRMAGAIFHSQAAAPTLYTQVVTAQSLNLESCALCQEFDHQAFSDCASSVPDQCGREIGAIADEFGVVLGALVITAAPGEFSSKDAQLQMDVASADTDLLNLEFALFSGNPAGTSELSSYQLEYQRAFLAVNADIAAILQS